MRETSYLTENKDALSLLQRIEKFQAFTDDDLKSFLEVGKIREYEAGETIIRKGESDQWVFFLLSGQVKIVKGEKTFAVLKRGGDLFGEMGVIDRTARSASVWAQTKVTILGIDCSKLAESRTLRGTIFHYTIFRLFAECLADRLRVTNEEVLRLQKALGEKEAELEGLKNNTNKGETLWV
jgi:CRP-like cAMP-binding protein